MPGRQGRSSCSRKSLSRKHSLCASSRSCRCRMRPMICAPLLKYLDRELTNAILPRTRLSYHVQDMCPKKCFVQARLRQDQQRQIAEETARQAADVAARRKEAEIAAVQQAIDARVLLPSQNYSSEPGIPCSGHSSRLCISMFSL